MLHFLGSLKYFVALIHPGTLHPTNECACRLCFVVEISLELQEHG